MKIICQPVKKVNKQFVSGVAAGNLSEYWDYTSGFIVGSHFKKEGYWKNPISEERLKVFMDEIKKKLKA